MKTFLFKTRYGMAVINAETQEEAWKTLCDYEDKNGGSYLTFHMYATDLVEISEEKKGVLAYMAE